MYNVHQDVTLIPVTFNGPGFVLAHDSLPALSVSASNDKNKLVHVSLVNIDPVKNTSISIILSGNRF
ncbi:MAG: hypothetical protein ABI813_00295 [Bacteroidota bacterium]